MLRRLISVHRSQVKGILVTYRTNFVHDNNIAFYIWWAFGLILYNLIDLLTENASQAVGSSGLMRILALPFGTQCFHFTSFAIIANSKEYLNFLRKVRLIGISPSIQLICLSVSRFETFVCFIKLFTDNAWHVMFRRRVFVVPYLTCAVHSIS